MPSLFVPPRLAAELQEERQQREGFVHATVMGADRVGWVKEFDAQLDRIVAGMQLVPCPDPAPVDVVAAGFSPGRWHVVWPGYNGGPLNVHPLVMGSDGPRLGGDGEFVEPGSWVFDALASADLWSERVQRDRRRIQREREEAKARRVERERAERDEDVLERYLAASRAFVSMDRSVPWSQNSAGRRGAGEKT